MNNGKYHITAEFGGIALSDMVKLTVAVNNKLGEFLVT
jgi:hypothetical protein